MRFSLVILSIIITFQAVVIWHQQRRFERELKIASGDYILAAKWGENRRLFCCRARDASLVVPMNTSFRVELATREEAVRYTHEDHPDSAGRWIAIPER